MTEEKIGEGIEKIDFDLASDVQEFILMNPDVIIDPKLRVKIDNMDKGAMLKVTKHINSLKIVNVEEITQELLEEKLRG